MDIEIGEDENDTDTKRDDDSPALLIHIDMDAIDREFVEKPS